VQTTLHFPRHPSEDALENYAFHRLAEEDSARLEEHLMLCETCQEALDKAEQFILLMKASTGTDPAAIWAKPFRPVKHIAPIKHIVWSGGLAAVFLVVGLISWPRGEVAAPAPVTLASFRGTVAMAHAPGRRPLSLAIDAPDVPLTGAYRIEIVTAVGKPAWRGGLAAIGGKLTALVPARLDAGVYWVRLYAGDSELLREFGLKLE
jgi:hypothetical protein